MLCSCSRRVSGSITTYKHICHSDHTPGGLPPSRTPLHSYCCFHNQDVTFALLVDCRSLWHIEGAATGRSSRGCSCRQLHSSSCCRAMHPSPSRSPQRQLHTLLAVLCIVSLQLTLVTGKCPTPQWALSDFIDPATPAEFCTKAVCVGPYSQCCGASPNSCNATSSAEQLELVFSDEFEGYSSTAALGSPSDIRWTSMDYHYSSDKNEWQNYKPEQVTVLNGQLLLTMEDKNSTAIRYGVSGPDEVFRNKTSGMVQSWNKFCFTGGYVEFSVKLPGNSSESGFWAATWLMGNLGRAGHYPSLEGMWPFSYDGCANGDRAQAWNDNKTQRISRCSGGRGRGAPEIDVLEYGKLGGPTTGRPTYVHTMQMGPVIPPFTSWMDASGQSGPGISLPGKSTPFETQLPNYRGQLTREGFPRTGSSITDTYTGSSYLDGDPNATESYFNKHHNYGLLWEPGEYVRWYLDDVLLFEVDKEALRAQSAGGLTVEQRLIPKEPSYLIMNLAMSSNAWAKVDDTLTYPGVMSVDHVRIWQRPGRVSIGCDTPDYPTSEYISCNRDLYMPESEKGTWKFVYCGAFRNVENQFLLGLGVSCAAVLSIAVVLMSFMWQSFKQEQQLQDQPGRNLPQGITAARTPQEKIRGCYINKGGPELQEVLRHTRPDLIAAAEATVAAETKAKK